MLSENIKSLRKAHGISQEELAVRLNVVRQTVSKWEKGISVPDADVVSKIADIFEVSVSDLLGTRIETEPEQNALAEQLARINEQFAIKNQRSKHEVFELAVNEAEAAVVRIMGGYVRQRQHGVKENDRELPDSACGGVSGLSAAYRLQH